MARTNRKDGPPAPPSSVDALDDLNLDDMFEGGDDSLFDGLDIDLDGMGDITGADEKEKGGDKEEVTKGLDDIKPDLLSADVPAPSTSKRRKTKRKAKTPPPLEEEETEEEQPKKKRRTKSLTKKKSKSKSKKSSAVDADTVSSPERPTKISKSKSKKTSSASMPPPLPRGSSGGVVAAAGQFGGRTQKGRVSFSLPMARANAERNKKNKSRSSTTSPSAGSTKAKGRTTAPPIQESIPEPPKPQPVVESTYCGLKPSDTLFYPFLPCLPSEPGMKKVHKLYPIIDKLHAAFAGLNSSSAQPMGTLTSAQEAEALFRLMVGDSDIHANASVEQSNARKSALAASIVSSRKIFSEADKSRIVSDLHSICALIKRQFDFLNISLGNMEKWCKNHFSEADYASVYGPAVLPQSSNRKRKASAIDMKQGFKGFSFSAIKVKLKFPGFKEPKMAGSLIAALPAPPGTPKSQPVTAPPTPQRITSRPKIEGSKSPAPKKKKTSVSSAPGVEKKDSESAITVPAAVVEVEAAVPYANLKPSQRRERILDAVTRKAHTLEAKVTKIENTRSRDLIMQAQALNKAVDEDPLVINNTAGLWQWVEKTSYFADFTINDINGILHCAWQPEMNEREMFWGEIPPVYVRTSKEIESKLRVEQDREKEIGNEILKKGKEKLIAPVKVESGIKNKDETSHEVVKHETQLDSDKLQKGIKLEEQDVSEDAHMLQQESVLFDRLSCLLIEEDDSDDDDMNDDGNEDSVSEWIRVSREKAQSLTPPEECSIVDLSQLSLDEKAYLHLQSIGLVDTPMLPSLKPKYVEADEILDVEVKRKISKPVDNGHRASDDKRNGENGSNISDVIRAMQDDLSDLHRLNNSRTALVRSMAISHLKHIEQTKKKEEEHVSLITRHNALMKKQKESKRSARQKSHKKSDEDWVPW